MGAQIRSALLQMITLTNCDHLFVDQDLAHPTVVLDADDATPDEIKETRDHLSIEAMHQ